MFLSVVGGSTHYNLHKALFTNSADSNDKTSGECTDYKKDGRCISIDFHVKMKLKNGC